MKLSRRHPAMIQNAPQRDWCKGGTYYLYLEVLRVQELQNYQAIFSVGDPVRNLGGHRQSFSLLNCPVLRRKGVIEISHRVSGIRGKGGEYFVFAHYELEGPGFLPGRGRGVKPGGTIGGGMVQLDLR